MSQLNDYIDELKNEESNSGSADTSTSTSTTENVSRETTTTETQQASEPKPKKDLSGISDADKAAYSFRKQQERREKKMRDEFGAMLDERFKAFASDAEAKKKAEEKATEPKKTRKDFQNDEEYLDHIVQERVAAILGKRDEEAAKQKEEADRKAGEEKAELERNQRMAQGFANNITAIYQGEDLEGWKQRIASAAKRGMGKVLEASPLLKEFVMGSRLGPVLLDKLVTDPNSLRRLAQNFSNPMEYQMELYSIAKEAEAERQSGASAGVEERKTPHIGKPGAGVGSPAASKGMFDDDAALRKFMRNSRRR